MMTTGVAAGGKMARFGKKRNSILIKFLRGAETHVGVKRMKTPPFWGGVNFLEADRGYGAVTSVPSLICTIATS